MMGSVEASLRGRGVVRIIGVDEAGRGPLAGPVHAAAYFLELAEELPEGLQDLDDSKKLKADVRERLFESLSLHEDRWALSASSAKVVDEINVLQATFRAMKAAVDEVVRRWGAPDLIVVDGNMVIPGVELPQQAIVKGDGKSRAIAAASIAAKVSRDRVMAAAAETWPAYGFESNKGYGTAAHREALRIHGPCEIHRRSFAGVVLGE